MPLNSFLTLTYLSLDAITECGVPIFLIVSGCVLYYTYGTEFETGKFLKTRLIYIVPSYILFSTFYMFVPVYGSLWGRNVSIQEIVLNYIRGTGYYHLWFFTLIILLYIFYPLIATGIGHVSGFLKNESSAVLIVLLAAILLVVIQPFTLLNSITEISRFIRLFPFFIIGIYISINYKRYQEREPSLATLVLLWPLLIFTTYRILLNANRAFNHSFSFALLFSEPFSSIIWVVFYYIVFCMVFEFAVKMNIDPPTRESGTLALFGAFSWGIYLIHPIFIAILVKTVYPLFSFSSYSPLFYPISLIIVSALSLLAVMAIHRMPGNRYVIGKVDEKTGSPASKNV